MAFFRYALHRLLWRIIGSLYLLVCFFFVFDTTQLSVYLLTDMQARFGLQSPPSTIDLLLFPALRNLEIPLILILIVLDESLCSVCSVLGTIPNSPISLEVLTVLIHLGEEQDVDCEVTADEDDVSRISLVVLKTSRFRSQPRR